MPLGEFAVKAETQEEIEKSNSEGGEREHLRERPPSGAGKRSSILWGLLHPLCASSSVPPPHASPSLRPTPLCLPPLCASPPLCLPLCAPPLCLPLCASPPLCLTQCFCSAHPPAPTATLRLAIVLLTFSHSSATLELTQLPARTCYSNSPISDKFEAHMHGSKSHTHTSSLAQWLQLSAPLALAPPFFMGSRPAFLSQPFTRHRTPAGHPPQPHPSPQAQTRQVGGEVREWFLSAWGQGGGLTSTWRPVHQRGADTNAELELALSAEPQSFCVHTGASSLPASTPPAMGHPHSVPTAGPLAMPSALRPLTIEAHLWSVWASLFRSIVIETL